MELEHVRLLTEVETLKVQLLEARLQNLVQQQATLTAVEGAMRAEFGLTSAQFWQINPDTMQREIVQPKQPDEPAPDPEPAPEADAAKEA